jgi:hypothetical protein
MPDANGIKTTLDVVDLKKVRTDWLVDYCRKSRRGCPRRADEGPLVSRSRRRLEGRWLDRASAPQTLVSSKPGPGSASPTSKGRWI